MTSALQIRNRNWTRARRKLPPAVRGVSESPGTDSALFDRFRPLDTLAEGNLCKKFSHYTQARSMRDGNENHRARARFLSRQRAQD
jgi:hypothetical protein